MYFRLILKNVPAEQEESISDLCFTLGASGISENLQFRQNDLNYEPETIPTSVHQLEVYFTEPVPEEALVRLRTEYPLLQYELISEADRDWMEEWKKHFRPFQLAGPYWVVPSWLPTPSEAQKVLRIDPGMAFGTGTHATTRMAARILFSSCKAPASLLDVGTGSGILAILAAQLGCQPVVGTDIDPMAREVACENADLNQSSVQVPEVQIDQIDEKFDWVIANIIDGVLLQLQPQLLKCCKPLGKLILTGILMEREEAFILQWKKRAPEMSYTRFADGEWVAFLCEGIG